jgi:type II secretory pathway pseudopilin PulG
MDKKDSGFSLVEALVTVVIVGMVMIAIGTFFLKSSKQNTNIAQAMQDREYKRDLEQSLRSDFETLGNNLTVNFNEVFPANALTSFLRNKYYTINNSTITKNENDSSAEPLVSGMLWQGTGNIKFSTAVPFSVKVASRTVGGGIAQEFSYQKDTFYIYEGSSAVYSSQIPPGQTVSVEYYKKVIPDESGLCLNSYFLDGVEVYRSDFTCKQDWYQAVVELFEAGDMDFTQTGATFLFNDDENNPVRLPYLPFFGGVRASTPVVPTEKGFAFIVADSKASPYYLNQESVLNEGERSNIHLISAAGEELPEAGDVLLIADFWQNRSCVVQIIENGADGSSLQVIPVTQDVPSENANFQLMYSMPSDFAGHIFPVGVRVIKLAPPVVYEHQESGGLFRRVGASPWTLVMPSVEKLKISETRTNGGIFYSVNMQTGSEETEIQAGSQSNNLTFAPRGLNRSLDVQ